MARDIWMYQHNPRRYRLGTPQNDAHSVRRDPVEDLRRALSSGPLEEWPIFFHARHAKRGDIVVIKVGGPRPAGIVAITSIERIRVSRSGSHKIRLRPNRKATALLAENPIPIAWVREHLPHSMGNLVKLTPDRSVLENELQRRGILIEDHIFAPPGLRVRVSRIQPTSGQVIGFLDERLSEEGRRQLVSHVAYERSRRNRAIVLYGRSRPFNCEVCEFSFETAFGKRFADYIEVHHLRPVSSGARTSKRSEFALLCANCHAIAHWRTDGVPRPVKELRRLIGKNQS